MLQKKRTTKKKEREILKTLETITGSDELAKGFLAKATSTPNKEQIVFVLIHQKTGFLCMKLHYTRNTKFLMTQKQEMEIMIG